ncbi:hypothetical protein CDL15_Pgr020636 [Punica granatum]|uniref:Uncharacterized protein n=1 Tax=Punica granatum TaxID=22663 RepID=A0A218XNH4_PUNGR|nr:hypothetical protein CDL15_Pgr020636 [Punica granatum]
MQGRSPMLGRSPKVRPKSKSEAAAQCSKCRAKARHGAEVQKWGCSPKVGLKPDAVNAGLNPDGGHKPKGGAEAQKWGRNPMQ